MPGCKIPEQAKIPRTASVQDTIPGILFSVRGDERLNMLYFNYFDYFVYFDYFTFLTFVTTPDALQ